MKWKMSKLREEAKLLIKDDDDELYEIVPRSNLTKIKCHEKSNNTYNLAHLDPTVPTSVATFSTYKR